MQNPFVDAYETYYIQKRNTSKLKYLSMSDKSTNRKVMWIC